ncbi:NADH:ubiquinone reductase (Na(+)-transporting) subunit C [uncultured Duncaniella sp.]|uniref:NADH:ubiquinone reductase (Na(+)-transporting) subunit C n=1 Tax=uncultured Duncaniella sp. TaxID=2768039 RepID=UPI002711F943|nr:NADH:ubiquinone reductase (Na(+)-transporting) subunit C [uncultured Duncaniella sp.]
MNKQSNTYTVVYIIVLVVVVGAALAFTSMSLRDRQIANANADKMKQILASVRIECDAKDVKDKFNKHITAMLVVDTEGNVVKTGGPDDMEIFNIDVAAQAKLADSERELPVYVCTLADDRLEYIIPVSGNGLWGQIWGYVALDADGSTVYGAYFSHASETPGLGAEIANPKFQKEFIGKEFFKNGRFLPVTVVKAGQRPTDGSDYVDGISGGTITSKGVGAMLDNCLRPYDAFLQSRLNK